MSEEEKYKPTKQLLGEYYKEHPEKKPLLHRIKERRDEARQEREHYGKIYKESYAKARVSAIKKRARQEAYDKHRPTKKQRMDSMLKGFESLGGSAMGVSTKQRRQPSRKKGKKKRKQQTKSQPRGSFDFNFDFVDDIGDFEF